MRGKLYGRNELNLKQRRMSHHSFITFFFSVDGVTHVQPVGCDDIVGSPKTYDACGVCGGQNHTCYRVNGICTRNKSWSAGGQ